MSDLAQYIVKAIKSGPLPKIRDLSRVKPKNMTLGEKVVYFIETYLHTPDGAMAGKPIKLLDFQKAFIISVFDNPVGTRRAYFSIARKNGKTALMGGILIAMMVLKDFPNLNAQLVSGAMSRDQASLLYNYMAKMIRLSPKVQEKFQLVDSQKRIKCITTGAELKTLARDGATAQGLSPLVSCLDEIGQITGPTDSFVDAITSSQGAHTKPILFAFSTQAASDSDMMSIWLDDAERSNDQHTVSHIYEADFDCDLLDEVQWKQANPALDIFRNRLDLQTQLERANRMPSAEPSARNLLLNQRVSLQTLFVSPSVWKQNNKPIDVELFKRSPVHIGLDLSSRNDLTAAVGATKDPETDIVHVTPFVFTPVATLEERGRQDRVPYLQWAKDGFLSALPGSHLDYRMILEELVRVTQGWEIASVQFDRWRIEDFKKAADDLGWAQEAEWIPVGQGFKDFSLRLEGLESLLLTEKINHAGHPLLNMAAANAIVETDPTGARKLAKNKSSQRIDPLVALAMAVYPLSDGTVAPVDIDAMIF